MRPIIAKLLAAPILIGAACVLAGLFGALHNQVSYTVGPTYFTEFKFQQFRVPPEHWGRLAVSRIGWMASWWMGLLLGPLLLVPMLFAQDARRMVTSFLRGALLVFAFAAGGSLFGYVMACLDAADPFWLAGGMHNGAYAGAGIGALLSAMIVTAIVVSERRAARRGAA